MILQLYPKDFKHIPQKSHYNHNIYRYVGKEYRENTEILEICHEEHNEYVFYLMDNDHKVFLGCSNHSIDEDTLFITVDFRMMYT